MLKSIGAVALTTFALMVAMPGFAHAGPTPADKCAGGKMKATAKKAACELLVDAKVTVRGIAHSKGFPGARCVGVGPNGGLETTPGGDDTLTCADPASTACTSDADCVAVGTNCGQQRCGPGANAGMPCTGDPECLDADCEESPIIAGPNGICDSTAAGDDVQAIPVGSGEPDYSKCTEKFAAAFSKLEAGGGCDTAGDAASIECGVDGFVSNTFLGLSKQNRCIDITPTNGACPRPCGAGGKCVPTANGEHCHCVVQSCPRCEFDSTTGLCGGACLAGHDCLTVAVYADGTGRCQCVPHSLSCGDTSGGTCPGYCPGPLQSCAGATNCACQ